jgi:energy-coupling factor transporter ATP-binding protein EcfA2
MTTQTPVVRVQHLTYAYPGTDLVLDDVSFDVHKGEMLGIIGPNGAGKSTLCKAINGLVPHFYGGRYGGSVLVEDLEVMAHSVAELSLKVGFVFQDPSHQLSGVSTRVDEEVAFGMSMMGFPREEMNGRIESAMKAVGLTGLEKRNPFELSGGQQQRLAIATVLAVKPAIIVLDEPTAQLDPVGKNEVLEVMRSLNGEGYTIIVAEHEIEELATFADRLILLEGGRVLAAGTAREVLVRVDELKTVGVDPPSVTELAHLISTQTKLRPDQYPITLDEALKLYRARLGA